MCDFNFDFKWFMVLYEKSIYVEYSWMWSIYYDNKVKNSTRLELTLDMLLLCYIKNYLIVELLKVKLHIVVLLDAIKIPFLS